MYTWKTGVKQINTTQEKLLQSCIFYPIARESVLNKGQNAANISFFDL